jgi:hypothetical protein
VAEDEMKTLMLAILVVSLGLTSACFVFKTKEVQSGQPLTEADCERAGGKGGVPGHVEKRKWRILPVGEVHDQPAALAGGHRRNAPWARV